MMARILSIYIDPNVCTCSQGCVVQCPEVLDGNTNDNVPRVRDGAERYFETHFEQIRMAAYVCPVDAVRLEVESD
jgi:ferredoxin